MSSAAQPRRLADALAELASLSRHPVDVTDLVHAACARACEVLEADGAIVLLSRDGMALEPAGTFGALGDVEAALAIERVPCRTAMQTNRVEEYRHESAGGTYPEYARFVGEHGIHRVLSVPLPRAEGQVLGTISATRMRAADFTAWEREAAQQLAEVVAAALVHEEQLAAARAVTAQLEHALQARVVVEQAKGMVAAELDVSIADALEMLRQFARRQHLRLADVSQDVVDRTLPMALLRYP